MVVERTGAILEGRDFKRMTDDVFPGCAAVRQL